ncbi:hypothetical protein [Streptomyces luteireticuli]|uniref:hypothetical protein n=1 Tax=Streptomyces luteireticuli TaxID=173858 RepID=UPI003558D4BB
MISMSRRSRAAAAVATCGLAGALLLPGVATAAPQEPQGKKCNGQECESVVLPDGQTLWLPYPKLPRETSTTGVPGGTTPVPWRTAQRIWPERYGGNMNILDVYTMMQSKFPDKFKRKWLDFDGVYAHGDDDPDHTHGADFNGLADVCRRGDTSCVFVGKLTKTAPVLAETNMIQGPTDIKITTSSSQTTTHTESSGWSVSGTIEGTIGVDGASMKRGGSFSYSRSSSDTNSYTQGGEVSYDRKVPGGKFGYDQMRVTGGEYTGFLVVANNNLDVFPVSGIVKGPGAWPAITSNGVFIDDPNANSAAVQNAKKVQDELAEARSQLAKAQDNDRGKLSEKVDDLQKKFDKALSGLPQKVTEAQFR